jgi:chromosome segregation ATPase
VVETLMQIALGFLAATLIALALLPAIHRRADRLSRRRMEALFPLSVAELTAEKDHLRAEFAVEQRRLEREAERVKASKAADLQEIGQRAVTIKRLEDEITSNLEVIANRNATLAARDETIAGLARDLNETRSRVASAEARIVDMTANLTERADHIARQSTEISELSAQLDARRLDISGLEINLASKEALVADLQREVRQKDAELKVLRDGLAQAESRLINEHIHVEALRDRIEELDTLRKDHARRITDQNTQIMDFKQRLADVDTTISSGEATITERDKTISQLTKKLDTAQAKLLKKTDEGKGTILTQQNEITSLIAERNALTGALEQARSDRTKLQQDISRLRRTAQGANAMVETDNTALRQQIDAVAEAIASHAKETSAVKLQDIAPAGGQPQRTARRARV